jgi:3-methyladenine DNA glycosylase AlkD
MPAPSVGQLSKDVAQIQDLLRASATVERQAAARKFAPTAEKIYGVRLPVLNVIAQQFTAGGLPLAQKLWALGAFEERLIAAKIVGRVAAKDRDSVFAFVQTSIADLRDWAVCDTLATQGVRRILITKREELLALSSRLIRSHDLWSRRFGVVLLTNFARERDLHADLAARMKPLKNESEHYVKKAMEWLSRDLAKAATPET